MQPSQNMPGFFYNLGYNLGRQLSPKLSQANWILRSLTGTEAESIRAEFAVGRDLARSFTAQLGACPDAAVNDLVADLGAGLAGRVENRQWRFTFRVVEAPEINAFALPGGFVFLTRSLVEFCDRDRAELAFIVGHEMGHVVRRHAMDRLMADTALRAALAALPAARGLAGQSLTRLTTTLMQQSYSQDQELEADGLGAQLARRAGFDPRGAIRALERLAAKSGDISELSSYLSSHPPFDMRVQNLQRVLRE